MELSSLLEILKIKSVNQGSSTGLEWGTATDRGVIESSSP